MDCDELLQRKKKVIDSMLPDEDYFMLRKTKYKGGGP